MLVLHLLRFSIGPTVKFGIIFDQSETKQNPIASKQVAMAFPRTLIGLFYKAKLNYKLLWILVGWRYSLTAFVNGAVITLVLVFESHL